MKVHIIRSAWIIVLAISAGGGNLLAGCSSTREAHIQTRRPYPRIVLAEDIPCYADPVPGDAFEIVAFLDTDSATTTTVEARESLMPQLRLMASKSGAEAVYDIKMLPRQTRGMVHDPNAPKLLPAFMPGWTDRYFLRGVAVISKDHLPVDLNHYMENPANPAPEDFPAMEPERSHLTGPSPHALPEDQLKPPVWTPVLNPSKPKR